MSWKHTPDERKFKILIVEDEYIEAHNLELILKNAGYEISGMARSVDEAWSSIEKDMPDLVCVDIFLRGHETGIDLAAKLHEKRIAFIYISANSGRSILDEAKKTQPYGFIVKPFREEDVITTLEIAFYRNANSMELQLLQESILQKNIEAISYSPLKWEQAFLQFGKVLQTYIPFDYLEASPQSTIFHSSGLLNKNYDNYELITAEKFARINAIPGAELDSLTKFSIFHPEARFFVGDTLVEDCSKSPLRQMVIQTFGIKSYIAFPVFLEDNLHFQFLFYSRNDDTFTNEQIALLNNLCPIITKFVKKAYTIPTSCKAQDDEKKILERSPIGFEAMVGTSQKMVTVFNYIKKVAPSETSVLILGESGTGKEKVAQSIHRLSPRKDKPLVIINCGAIPDNLAESLLFGHEKGSFTGAIEKRTGKFEQADGGTIFLDEIGEMPMDLQVKLLRVLQEREIERIGGGAPIKTNVRIIAATNRNLEDEVAAGRFRLDLYYRLHVFPIVVPPLRERKEDIGALAGHFLKLYAPDKNQTSISFSDSAMQEMNMYHWPGNIRQLEHHIQRSILLTDSNIIESLDLPVSIHKTLAAKNENASVKTIHEIERDYISYILQTCKGKVSGSGGAAEILNIPASTLTSKIKKLGIIVGTLPRQA